MFDDHIFTYDHMHVIVCGSYGPLATVPADKTVPNGQERVPITSDHESELVQYLAANILLSSTRRANLSPVSSIVTP